MIHVLQLPLLSRTPGQSVMPPKGKRGLLKRAGKPQGAISYFAPTEGPARQRQGQPDLAALSIPAPEVPGHPELLTQKRCPPLPTPAQGRKPPHKHLTAASLFCSGSGPQGANSNKLPSESACWRLGKRPPHLRRTC